MSKTKKGARNMKVTYHGHSAVKIETNGKTIFIDPFITGNPMTDLKPEDVHVDVILLTHGHNDHVGDTVSLAKKNDALVIAPYELATYLSWEGVRIHPMHIGGSFTFDFGKIKFTQAFHGSSYVEENETIVYTGMPSGILFQAEGKTIYHAGDTALFSDMKLIGEMNDIDVAFLPIGITLRWNGGCGDRSKMVKGENGCSNSLQYIPCHSTRSATVCGDDRRCWPRIACWRKHRTMKTFIECSQAHPYNIK